MLAVISLLGMIVAVVPLVKLMLAVDPLLGVVVAVAEMGLSADRDVMYT